MDIISPNFIYAFIFLDFYLSILAHCNRVTAIDWCQILLTAKYLNKWTEFGQTLYMLLYVRDLDLDC